MMANGGKVPALVSPGEKYLNPQAVQQVAQGANPMSVGETIPASLKSVALRTVMLMIRCLSN